MAGSKITDLTELTTVTSSDELAIVNASVTKKITQDNLIPDATATVKGKAELATNAEAIAGTDTGRTVTPANITAKIDTDVTLAGDSDTRIPSQKAIKAYSDASGGDVLQVQVFS